MDRVLVTGATGFIGRRLVERLLARGDDVRCFVRASPRADRLKSLPVPLVFGEFTEEDRLAAAVRDVDVVYHLAGATTGRHRDDYYRVNQRFVENLATACAGAETPPLLVHVSSLAAGGPSKFGRPIREPDPPRPVSIYGKSKWEGERALYRQADRLPVSIVRPPIVFGPGDTSMLNMYRSVKSGVHVIPCWRRQQFSLIHVDDLVDGMLAVSARGARITHLDDPEKPGVYYLSTSDRPTYGELGTLVSQAMGRPRNVLKLPVPSPLSYALGGVAELFSWFQSRPSIINLDKMREATAGSWICSAERANVELGHAPSRPLLDRLRETATWYFEQEWL